MWFNLWLAGLFAPFLNQNNPTSCRLQDRYAIEFASQLYELSLYSKEGYRYTCFPFELKPNVPNNTESVDSSKTIEQLVTCLETCDPLNSWKNTCCVLVCFYSENHYPEFHASRIAILKSLAIQQNYLLILVQQELPNGVFEKISTTMTH